MIYYFIMDKNLETAYKKIGRYSLWFAIAGIICYMTFFPDGIFYSFFCGIMAVASFIVAKRSCKSAGSVAGLIIGIIDIGMGVMAFYGLYLIYSAAADPVVGPKVAQFLSNMLSQYGVSLDQFISTMSR